MFDSLGNYLYSCSCIRSAFGISKQRLTRQRNIKRKEYQEPTSELTKTEVEEQRLGQYVIMPASVDSSFKNWWRALKPSATVIVRMPHSRHGNAGQVSHSANTSLREQFLKLITVSRMVDQLIHMAQRPTLVQNLLLSKGQEKASTAMEND